MAYFHEAFELMLKHEGYYSDDKDDRVGPTMMGISSVFVNHLKNKHLEKKLDRNKDGFIDAVEIQAIELPMAYMIYHRNFWENNQYFRINSQKIANAVFDFAVNAGSKRSNLTMQEAINIILNDINEQKIAEDGIIGKITLKNINQLDDILLDVFNDQRILFYKSLADKNKKYKKFLKGWIRRVKNA